MNAILKVTELRLAMIRAEAIADQAGLRGEAEVAYTEAMNAYLAEKDAAKALKTQYYAMGDDDCSGLTNAGDTFDKELGDDRFMSTEYWNCAIATVQLLRDSTA